MATAVASAMPNEAPLLRLPTKDDPAIPAPRIAAKPTDVSAIPPRERMTRTRAYTCAYSAGAVAGV